MCLYITYVATRTSPPPLQYSTIKNYSYGIQSYHSSEHQIEHWLSTLTLYHKCMKGIKRHLGEKGKQLDRPRYPITTSLLTRMHKQLTHISSNYPQIMFWAAATLGTYGLLRMSEFCVDSTSTTFSVHSSTSSSVSSSSPSSVLTAFASASINYRLLTLQQITLYTINHTIVPVIRFDLYSTVTYYTINLRVSKTDQGRKGLNVVIGHNTPVSAMLVCLRYHPFLSCSSSSFSSSSNLTSSSSSNLTSPLFVLGVLPLSRSSMIDLTRTVISSLGLDSSLYHGHSFRRGGATSLADAGIDHDIIKTMGRWKSDCYQIYIQTTTDRLLQSSRAM